MFSFGPTRAFVSAKPCPPNQLFNQPQKPASGAPPQPLPPLSQLFRPTWKPLPAKLPPARPPFRAPPSYPPPPQAPSASPPALEAPPRPSFRQLKASDSTVNALCGAFERRTAWQAALHCAFGFAPARGAGCFKGGWGGRAKVCARGGRGGGGTWMV